jgi:hypothetical protein
MVRGKSAYAAECFDLSDVGKVFEHGERGAEAPHYPGKRLR